MAAVNAARRRTRVVVLALACASGVGLAAPRVARAAEVHAQADGNKERSRAAFKKGVAQLRTRDWSGARASFEQALSLFPHPSILLNLGIARLRTGEPILAEQDLVRFLSEDADASAEELASAREALAEARGRIGTLRVVVSPVTARLTVDGKSVEPVKRGDADGVLVAEIRTVAGPHAIVASADGHDSGQRDVEVPAKGESEVKLVLAPTGGRADGAGSASYARKRALLGWSAAGLSGAAVVTSGVLGLVAISRADDYNDRTSGSYQDPEVKSEGIAMRTGADVALGVAVLAGAAAVVLLLTDLGAPSGATRAPGTNTALLRW